MIKLKIIFNNLYIILSLILIVGCSSKEEKHISLENYKNKEIVIIFNSINNLDHLTISLSKSFDNYSNNKFIISKNSDTIKIDLKKSRMLFIGSKNTFLDSIITNPGDTITVQLNDQSIDYFENGLTEKWSSINYLKNNKTKQIIDSLSNSLFAIDYSNPMTLNLSEYKIQSFKILNKRNSKPDEIIKKLIIEYQNFIKIINTQNFSKTQEKTELIRSYLKQKHFSSLILTYNLYKSESLINFLHSEVFLSEFNNEEENYFYLSNLLGSNYYNNNDTSLKKLYDSIPNYFDSIWVEKSRMILIEKMGISKNKNLLTKYLGEFQNQYNNDEFYNHIKNKYLVNLETIYKSPFKIEFHNQKRELKTFQNLLDSLKGKVIYVDFWASWCKPCIKAMPSSNALRKEFKNVEFVFISIDKNADDWMNASKTEKLNDLNHNYLMNNRMKSNSINKIKINRIPRYMIFDKNGKMVNHDAPGPDNEKLKTILNKLLH